MATNKTNILISENIGEISAIWQRPENPIAIIVLGHGAGAGMYHPFMENLALQLQEQNISSVRYQFPYMESAKKMPDRPPVAHKTIEAVLKYVFAVYTDIPLFVGGKSFGGRMSSQLLAKWHPEYVKGLIFYGFPLHPPGKISDDRAKHLNDIKIPSLFLQGSRDKLATPELIKQVTSKLSEASLHMIEGADHSFNMLKSAKVSQDETIIKLAKLTCQWIELQRS